MLCHKNNCTGCGACYSACPVGAIHMKEDEHGFLSPVIDAGRCVNCKKCEHICPQMNEVLFFHNNEINCYVGALENSNDIMQSSSGGIAYALASSIIEQGGAVIGAMYDSDMVVKHVSIESKEELPRIQGSKYVQSDLQDTYITARHELQKGRVVLYIGVPCQIAGLYAFLDGKTYNNLLTVDLLCGGATSPGVFRTYIAMLENKKHCKIIHLNFRDKGYGYGYLHCLQTSESGKKLRLRGADAGFVRSMGCGYVRESCFSCKYSRSERIGDITLGDPWGVAIPNNLYNRGVSVIIVNSDKGKKAIEKISNTIWVKECPVKRIVKGQQNSMCGAKKKPNNYDKFFHDYNVLGWRELYRRYLLAPSKKGEILSRIPACCEVAIMKIRKYLKSSGENG